ncbi:MAG: hypothetical protein WAX07_00115 [Candidatus Altiarchaeia archaeon]
MVEINHSDGSEEFDFRGDFFESFGNSFGQFSMSWSFCAVNVASHLSIPIPVLPDHSSVPFCDFT